MHEPTALKGQLLSPPPLSLSILQLELVTC